MNLKHKELNYWYHKQTEPKSSYKTYIARVVRYWYSKEKAILKAKLQRNHPLNYVDDNWWVCNSCKTYKLWELYSRTRVWYNNRTPNCLECRNKYKKEYRKRSNKNKEYKLRTRNPIIGSIIGLTNYKFRDKNDNPREVPRKVISYKKNKWYLLYSEKFKMKKYQWFGNKRMFYYIEN